MTCRSLAVLAATLLLPMRMARPDLASPAPVTAAVPRCATPPVLDGRLDDPCWTAAAPFTNFFDLDRQVFSGTALAARVAYDDAWLYAGISVRQPADRRRQAPAALAHDGFVQRDDCVKLYVDPGTAGRCYYLFKLNTLNVRQERRVVGGSDELGWNIPWRSAVACDADGWTAELAVPFSQMPPWEGLGNASFDLLNTRFETEPDGRVIRTRWSLAPQYEALRGGLVDPARFLRIRWASGLDPQAPFLPYLVSAAAGPIRAGDGGRWYDLDVTLRSCSGPGGSVVLRAEEQVDGRTAITATNLAVPTNAGSVSLRLPVRLATLAQREVALVLASETGEVWQRVPVDTRRTFDFLAAFAELNYYTSQKEARILYSLHLEPGALGGKALEVRDGDGNLLAGSAVVRPRGVLDVPIEGLAPGPHALEASLRESGSVLQTMTVPLVKRPPNPGMEWAIRRPSGTVLRNGVPFLPFGIYVHQHVARPATFRDAADIGFNSIAYWPYSIEPEQMDLALRQAADCGLTAFVYLEGPAREIGTSLFASAFSGPDLDALRRRQAARTLTGLKGALMTDPLLQPLPEPAKERLFQDYYTANRSRLLDGVRRVMHATNLAAYMHFDEPAPFQHPAMMDLYQSLNALDGYHPVIACYDHPSVARYADILLHRAYWIPATPGVYGTPNHVTRTLVPIRRSATEKRMGCWFILPIATAYLGQHQRGFLPDDMRCQTYVAMIHGAKGLYYFCYPIAHAEIRKTFVELADEWKTLTPFLGAPDVDQEIAYAGGPYDLVAGPFPDVQCRLFRDADGSWLLLAANTSPDTPADAAFDLGALQPTDRAERMFGGPAPTLDGGRLRDRLEPLGVRAYRFRGVEPPSGPVPLPVTQQPLRDQARPRALSIPPAQIGPAANVMRNPSFEEAALPGTPDYFSFYNIPPGRLLGSSEAVYRLDPADPVDGKLALRIAVGAQPGEQRALITYTPLPNDAKPLDYVFSLFVKTDQDGVTAKVRMAGKTVTIPVGRAWKRQSFACTVPARPDPENNLFVELFPIGTPYTVWVDALQMERGTDPSAFTNPPPAKVQP